MNIRGIKVLLTNTMDTVIIATDLPCQMPPALFPDQPPLDLMFYAPADGGVEYVRQVFHMEPEVINVRV